MAALRVNSNHVKLHRSYSVGELASRLAVHENTVRNWQRQGLKPIDGARPILFQGAVVRDFLKTRATRRKRPCGPGLFYCFRCREPRPPAEGMVDFLPCTLRSGNLRAICGSCGALMHRRASLVAIPAVMPGIAVQTVQGPWRLSGTTKPSFSCDSEQ